MPAIKSKLPDANAETRIKEAARIIFHKNGYAGTRTRDIANKANSNLALINYYFKNKEGLFQVVMIETLTCFYQTMGIVFNDETTSLDKKVELVTEKYIDLVVENPEMPLFIMNEMRNNSGSILAKLPAAKMILQSVFIKQFREATINGTNPGTDPLHFLINLLGLILFPFINNPAIKKIGNINEKQFQRLMQERKKLVPVWMKAILKAK